MRLPHNHLENVGLITDGPDELIASLGEECAADEAEEIIRLFGLGLPPVTSLNALSVMTGYNPGFVWSLVDRPERYYRVFDIPKGAQRRQIEAPRVALKLIQKWFSLHFERQWKAHDAVHGFVRGRSHISAARKHVTAEWVVSIDIENFFPSTVKRDARAALIRLGYRSEAALSIIESLCCRYERLAQGAPSSPVLSNIALHPIDQRVSEIADLHGASFTRYADDIVLSGKGDSPENITGELAAVFEGTSWRLSDRKRLVSQLPDRLKVHGLLVHGEHIRLTKGYRNRLRAFRHLVERGAINDADRRRIDGHLNYARQVEHER